ncbi:MAG: ATP-grasp domain-containing protein [Elusimicrobia bacterium]|nr:ATP-grasp domain-containing protein [Elusimicrobiota bacterium]
MPLWRRVLAASLAAVLTALAPGLEPYRLFAQVKGAVEVPVTVGTPGLGQTGAGTVGANLSLSAPPSLVSPTGLASTLPNPAALSPALTPKVGAGASAAAAPSAAAMPAAAAAAAPAKALPPVRSPAPSRASSKTSGRSAPEAAPERAGKPAPRAAGAAKTLDSISKGVDAGAALDSLYSGAAARTASDAFPAAARTGSLNAARPALGRGAASQPAAEEPAVGFLKKEAPAQAPQGFFGRLRSKLSAFSGFNRSEKAYILGQATFLFAISIYLASMPLLVQALTGDAAMTGVARAVHYWTFAGASLLSGGIVARTPMKRILVGAAVSRALIFGSIGFLALVGGLPWAGFLGLVGINAVIVSMNHLVDIDTDGARKVFTSDKKIEQGGYLYDLIYYGMMLVVPPLIGLPMDWLDATYGPGIGAAVGFAMFAAVMSAAAFIYAKFVKVKGNGEALLDALGPLGRGLRMLRSGWEILREAPRRNWETMKLLWRNKRILSRSAMATAENFVEDALFAVVLPTFAIDILKSGASGNGLLLSAVTLGGLIASTFLMKYAQKIQGRIGTYQFLAYLTIGASLAFIPSALLWSAPSLLLAVPAVVLMKMLYQPLRSRMRALLQVEIKNDPEASKRGEDINALMTVFEVLAAGAGGLAFAWLFGHAGAGTPLHDLLGDGAPMKMVTLAMMGISAVYLGGLKLLGSTLPRWLRWRSPKGAERTELDKLAKNLAKLGLPPAKTVRVANPVSADRPTVAILAPASVYKLSIAREGGRQAPGDVHLALDASWLVSERRPDGRTRILMKKGLFFDAEGQAWVAEYDQPRVVRYFGNFFTLGSNDRADGVPFEKGLDTPMTSSVELEAVTNDKLLTRVFMAEKGVGVPATLAFLLHGHPMAWRTGFDRNGVTLAQLGARVRAQVEEFLAANAGRLGGEVVVKPSGPQWHSSRGVKFFKTSDIDAIAAHVMALSQDGMMTPDGAVLIDERITPPPLYFRVKEGGARAPPADGYSGKGLRMGADVSLDFLSAAEAKTAAAAPAKRDWNMRLFAQRTPWGGTVNSAVFVRAGPWGKPTVAEPGGPNEAGKADPEDAAVVMPFEDVIKALQDQHGLLKTPAEAAAFREDLERTARGTLESLWENEAQLRADGRIPAQAQTDFVGLDVMLDWKGGKLIPKVIEINDHDSGGQMQLDSFYPERAGEHSRAWVATMLQRARRDALKGKRILMVGGGYYGKRFIFERAKELGVKITLVDRPGSLMADLVDRYIPVETLDKDGAAAAAESALAEAGLTGKFDGITSFWEDDIPLTAELGEKLGLPFLPVAGAKAARDKRATREVMAAAGLPAPRFAPVRSDEELEAAVASVGFPAIMKPASGAEAKFVKEVRSAAEARAAWKSLSAEVAREAATDGAFSAQIGLVMEQYLEGDEVDVDVVMQGGKPVFTSVTDNWPTKRPFFLATGSSLPSHLPSAGQAELAKLAHDSAAALKLDRGVLHIEMKLTPEGPRVIEVNARMGGVYVRDWVKDVWGVDLVEEGLMAAADIPGAPYKSPTPLTHLEGRFLIPERSGTLKALDGSAAEADPSLYELRKMIRPGAAVRVPPEGNDRVGMVTARGRSAAEAEAALKRVEAKVRMDVD